MIYGSVCSGIESASVAWHPLGWRPAFFAEIEPFPSSVLAHHYPDTPNLGDFTKIKESDVEPIELLVGGTPCQSFSVAGKRLGLDDPRGHLALEFLALARRLRPRWLVWENVPGVLSLDDGRTFGAFLWFLEQCGYGWAYRTLDAQYVRVDGYARAVPQRRRRVFVVGYFGDWRPAAAVLLEPESLRGDSPPRREAGKGIADGAISRALSRVGGGDDPGANKGATLIPILESGCRTGKSTDDPRAGIGIGNPGDPMFSLQLTKQHAIAFGGNNTDGELDVATACRAKGGTGHGDFESETFVAQVADPISASEGGTYTHEGKGNFRLHNCVAFDPTQITHPENRSVPKNLSPQLTESGYAPAIKFKPSHYTRGKDGAPSDAAPPLQVEANYGDQDPLLLTRAAVRRLTPRECERLQGFPDDYTLVPYNKKPAADGPRYKALGNAMAINCMRWIGARISLCDKAIKAAAKEAA